MRMITMMMTMTNDHNDDHDHDDNGDEDNDDYNEDDNNDDDDVHLLIGGQTAIGAFRYKWVGLWIQNLLNGWKGEM